MPEQNTDLDMENQEMNKQETEMNSMLDHKDSSSNIKNEMLNKELNLMQDKESETIIESLDNTGQNIEFDDELKETLINN